MAAFVEGGLLNTTLNNIIRNADEYLYLISPYIKLHDRIKDELKHKRKSPGLKIVVLFGKAEKGTNRITVEDTEFLKTLPNIEIRYEKNLHAKYYASEDGALVTSLNLYDFSQNSNIEAGIFMETPRNLISALTGMGKDKRMEEDAYYFFTDVISNSDLLYKKVCTADKSMWMKTTYSEPTVEVDQLEQFFNSKELKKYSTSKSNYSRNSSDTPADRPVKAEDVRQGFCIRTRKVIPFDLKMPYSNEAFSSWSKYKNEEYPEKYCHFSGELTKGETCFRKPVLNKYWKQSKQ